MPANLVGRVAQKVVLSEVVPEGCGPGALDSGGCHQTAGVVAGFAYELGSLDRIFETSDQRTHRRPVQVVQQCSLPVVPQAWIRAPDVRDGKQVKIVEVDVVADDSGELRHHRRIADVPALGGDGHEQVIPNQPRDELGVVFAEAVQRAELSHEVGADLGVVAVAPLRDVVEEPRDVDEFRLGQACKDVGAVGEFVVAGGIGEHPEVADHEQAVLVDGVDVEQVVLHLSRHLVEDGQVGAENSVAVHSAQLVIDAPRLAQDLQEQAAGTEIGSERTIDAVPVRAYEPDGRGAYAFEVRVLLQQQEYFEQRERMAAEDIPADSLHIAVDGLKAPVQRLDAVAAADVEDRLLEVPEQHLVQTRKLHHLAVVALHQVFDAEPAAFVLETQHFGQMALVIEQEPILGAPGEDVQREPHPPQEPPVRLPARGALRR